MEKNKYIFALAYRSVKMLALLYLVGRGGHRAMRQIINFFLTCLCIISLVAANTFYLLSFKRTLIRQFSEIQFFLLSFFHLSLFLPSFLPPSFLFPSFPPFLVSFVLTTFLSFLNLSFPPSFPTYFIPSVFLVSCFKKKILLYIFISIKL